jgi:hypothetical protein
MQKIARDLVLTPEQRAEQMAVLKKKYQNTVQKINEFQSINQVPTQEGDVKGETSVTIANEGGSKPIVSVKKGKAKKPTLPKLVIKDYVKAQPRSSNKVAKIVLPKV